MKKTTMIRVTEGPKGRKVRVSRSFLESLVREAVIRELSEDQTEDEDPGDRPIKEKRPAVDDATKASKQKSPRKAPQDGAPPGYEKRTDPVAKDKKGFDLDGPPEGQEDEVPAVKDPADDEVADDADGEGQPDKLSDELVGKTIQSVTMEPKSKLVPGAQELVLSFNEVADPLKVIITKTGEVRFFFRGALHNLV